MAALAESIRRSAIGLGLFAVITGGTIAVTQHLTADRIEVQRARAEAAALYEIIPESAHDNDLLNAIVTLPESSLPSIRGPVLARVASRHGEPMGLILPVTAPDGYSGDIHLLVGIALTGEILGVRVTGHKETPGLGDAVEVKKSDWILSFDGRSLKNPEPLQWNVRKNGGVFDQFTGATITPRAVVRAVEEALTYFEENRQAIMARAEALVTEQAPYDARHPSEQEQH